MKITSVNNDIVKETAKLLRGKYRDESGLFLIEGEKGVSEAIDARIDIERIFILENHNIDVFANEVKQSSINNLGLFRASSRSDIQIIETTEAVLSKISDAKSAPKVVAVARQPQYKTDMFKDYRNVVLLEGIKDAGNLGTILRTASAFGVDGIVLYGDTVDLYNPKCVRSTVGCLWKTPVIKLQTIEQLKLLFNDFVRVATLPKGEDVLPLKEYQAAERNLVMFGSEAEGLSDELKVFATKNVTIEMATTVESLNLSVSVAVVMYKICN